MLDLRVLENDGFLDASTRADVDTGTDGDVGAQLGGGVDVGGGMDEDGSDDVGARLGELLGAALPGLLQVQGVGRDGGAGCLDLAPEVLGLVYKEVLGVGEVTEDVLLEADNLVLALLVVVVEDEAVLEVLGARVGHEAGGTVGAALDGGLDGGEDGVGGEEVDTAVDQVADLRLGLLDVMEDAAGVGVAHDATEVGGGVVGNAGAENDGLGALVVEELQHLVKGERAADVGVQDEEALGAALEDGIAEMVETAGGAQGLVLAQVLDGEVGELIGGVLDKVAEDGLLVVADDEDLGDLLAGNTLDGRQAVPDDGVAGDFEEGLGDVEGEGAESSSSGRTADLEF